MNENLGVVRRSTALLRAVADCTGPGRSTTELARETDLPRATAHRLLDALAAEGLLDRDNASGRWHLGPEIYILGSASAPRYDVAEKAVNNVRALASETGESAFFSLRRGDHTVVLLRQDGDFPIRSHVLYEGARFPLGVVSAGLAVLSYLSDSDIAAYLHRANLAEQWGGAHHADDVRARIAETRRNGWALNAGLVVEGSWGMAAAVFGSNGAPIGALTLTGIESRFGAERRPHLGQLLLRHAHRLSEAVGR